MSILGARLSAARPNNRKARDLRHFWRAEENDVASVGYNWALSLVSRPQGIGRLANRRTAMDSAGPNMWRPAGG